MSALLPAKVETHWWIALGLAAAAHAAAISALLVVRGDAAAPVPDPVMVVELPAGAPPAPAQAAQPVAAADPLQELPTMVPPRIAVPEVEAPLPPDPVALPAPRPVPRQLVAPAPRPRPVPVSASAAIAPRAAPPAPATDPTTGPATGPTTGSANEGGGPGENSEAENDWYALVSAHLERSKRYPRAAKKAEQQGTPVVRFSVDRRGRVSAVSIRKSSGHDLLDEATIDLMQRVSPLPAMPRSMARESVTITLPIEYSLSRK